MTVTLCEESVWHIPPTIGKELAKCLVNNHCLSQKQAAEKLGITPAAVCQYIKEKRGSNQGFDDRIMEEINISAGRIIKTGKKSVIDETCRLCHIIRNNGRQKY